jgi:imidazolonepropionase-like amidohydrolase
VLTGWEKSVPELLKAQDDASALAQREQAQRLTHKPKNGWLVVKNARLFDPATLKTTSNATIVVHGKRIEAVGLVDVLPPDATVIDAAGKTVIPGMWDMHQHFSAVDGLLDLSNGVTTGRDLANDTDFLLALRKKFDDATAVGPHTVLAGIIDGPGPFAGPTKVLVDTPEKALAAVDNYAKLGYEQVKIYSSVKPELVPIIAKRAHEHGLRVSGHVPAMMRAEDAIRDGYDEIQHINFLMLQFMPDVKETRNPARFIEPGKRTASLDFNSDETKAFTNLMLQHHTVIDPTLAVFEEMYTARKGEVSPLFAAVADRMPPQIRRSLLGGGLPIPDAATDATYRASFKKMLDFVGRAYRAGVTVVAGTDDMAGFAYHRELELYAQAGIPPAEVLRIATLGAATVMHHEKDSGSVTPKKVADFAIVDGDPTTNISDVRRVVTVVKDGNVFETAEINRELGVR